MKEQTLFILACPLCHHALEHDKHKNYLICQHDHCYFPIHDQIPVLLPELAVTLPATPQQESKNEI